MNHNIIPWQDGAEFRQALDFLSFMDKSRGEELNPVRDLAREIEGLFHQMGPDLDRLCSVTCPGCRDNCCERATIWYDFRDLVYLYFGPGRMPENQIQKGRGLKQCSNLRDWGCALSREERPFVCTWYFCPDQKQESPYATLNLCVQKIKALRIQMEDEFCRITAG